MLVRIGIILQYLIIVICLIFLFWISMIEFNYQNKQCSSIHINQSIFNHNQTLNYSLIDSRLKLNHYTILGTHNSYHQRNRFFQYSHSSLNQQLDHGIRQIELDIHLMKGNNVIYHLQLFDDKTSCYCLKECLIEIVQYTSRNPFHYPIYLFLEIKQMFYEDLFTGLTGGIQCEHFQQIKDEILEIFPLNRFLLPRQIQGNEKSIQIALKKQRLKEIHGDYQYGNSGWPPIWKCLGKLIPVFIDDVHNIIVDLYSKCHSIETFYFIAQKNIYLPYSSIISISNLFEDKQLLETSFNQGLITRLLLEYNHKNPLQTYQSIQDYGIHILSSDFFPCRHHDQTPLCQRLTKDFINSTILCHRSSSPHFCHLSIQFFSLLTIS